MHCMNSFRAALLLITATTSLAALTPAAIAGPTPKRCGAPLSGVTHLRAATSITCALAQRVVRTREQRGKPPLGWNCNDAKKISGSRYYSKSCKLGLAHGGAIIRYWVLHPTAYSGAASSCGSVSLGGGAFLARSLSAGGMSCSSARREVRRGSVGAHGYQRYGGWRCSEKTGLRYTCRKAGKSFSFRLVSGG